MSRRWIVPLLVPFAVGAALSLTSCGESQGAPDREARPVAAVEAVPVTARAEPERFETAAEMVAKARIEVASRTAGRVVELPVTEGTRVAAGDLLIRLDAPELEAAAAEARAAEAAAKLAWETSRTQAERFRRLAESQVVTPRDLELAEVAAASARASLEQAAARTRMSERNLAYAEIRAPAAGRVVARRVRVGDLATPGRPLIVLEDPGELEIRVTVPAQIGWEVAAGDRAEIVDAPAAGPSETTVDRVAPGAEAHTLEVYLRGNGIPGPSGTFLRVALLGAATEPAIRVPEEALVRNGPLTGVFTAREGRARLTWVRLARDGRVLSGLVPGDSVVVRPPADLQDGDPVEVAS